MPTPTLLGPTQNLVNTGSNTTRPNVRFDTSTGKFIDTSPAPVQYNAPTTPDFQSNFASIYPNAGATGAAVAGNTLSRLRGELSPETLSAIQDSAARFGMSAGIPGSGISGSYGRKLLGQTVEGLQSQGLQDYLNTLKTYSGTLMPTTGEQLGAETSRYGTDVGAATSRYGEDVAARTAANALGQQAYQFGLTFPESQRQFDVNTEQNYLNNYLNFLK